MKTAEKIFVDINRWVLIAIMVTMAVIVFLNVLLRFFTNQSITWSDEVARHLMIWLTFLGAGITLRYGGLVAIDNLQLSASPRAAKIMRILVAAILLAFFVVMIWAGKTYVGRTMRQLTPSTRIPFGYVYMAIPIGFSLLIAHFLLVIRAFVGHGMSVLQEEDEAPPVAG
ncbi:TRAP transporter small permease [Rhizobiaceae bacterium BDR2-2]|uniref:TRAP transporter small permease protein n=1 Tax=Ectorhizobium quercum TaxID=2965071 RepID=A0AAE3SWJ1_9HYPH|nr:TRAP transporter small permease [Ectorhizobium quercum]MCX8998079.1 TRAP transporter small permease [Ectorhizobium quercum]